MSTTSVSIHILRNPRAAEHFTAGERGNYFAEDLSPVTEDTEISIDIGEDITVYMTVGQWHQLVDKVAQGIGDIPAKREQRIARQLASQARKAKTVSV